MAPWLVAVVLPPVFFAPYLGGRVAPFGDDILVLNYPLLSLLAHALRAGYPVLWNPYSGGGYPLVPFSALPFYPLTWLLAMLPVPAAMGWTYALDLVIGGLGSYALAGRLGVTPAARLVSAVAFPFSGFVLAHLFAGHFLEVGLICWFPAALAALHWALVSPTLRTALRRGLVCGGPLGMLVLANGISWLFFVGYPVALVAATLVVRGVWLGRADAAGSLPPLLRALLALTAAGLVAVLLGAAVLLPVREILGQTVRGGSLNYHALTRVSEPGLGLAMAVAPDLFGSDVAHTYWFPNPDAYFQEVYAYVGLPVLVLAVTGAVAGRRRRDVRLYASLAILGVVLALGANTPLYAVLSRLLPGLDVARVPARWLLLAVLATAVLAGVGADALLTMSARLRRPLSRPVSAARGRLGAGRSVPLPPLTPLTPLTPLAPLGALAVLLGLGLLAGALAATLSPHHPATIGPALARLLVVAIAAVLVVLAVPQLPRPAGAALLLILVTADLWSANGPLVRPLDPAPYYQNAAVDLAATAAGMGRVWALDRAIPLRRGMLDRRTYDVQDFAPLTLLDYWLFVNPGRTLQGVDTGMARADMPHYNGRTAVLLGVGLVVAPHPLRAAGLVPLARLRVPRFGLLNGDWSHPGPHPGPAYAYRVAGRLPEALPVYATRTARGRVPLAAVYDTSFDPCRVVLLDGGAMSVPAPPSNALLETWRRSLLPGTTLPTTVGPGVVQLGRSENGLVLRATMRRSGVLLLDQVYDRGWTATVDGHTAPLRRADYLLTALPLAAGAHTVTLVYAPPAYALGAALSLLGYLILLGALVAGRRQHAHG